MSFLLRSISGAVKVGGEAYHERLKVAEVKPCCRVTGLYSC